MNENLRLEELEKRIADLRSRPLLLVCRDKKGRQKVMTLEECCRTGSIYIHVAANDLDELLSAELGGEECVKLRSPPEPGQF
ncbi:MAG: hypothetical protein HDT16_07155 [Oscillibacter sp.]|nr:hypothetical protein [Oscillibacter sp.]